MPEQVEALINYVVREVAPESDDKTKFIYPYKASEVCSRATVVIYRRQIIENLVFRQCTNEQSELLTEYFRTLIFESQVLSADLAAVVDCIFQNDSLIDKLFEFLHKDPPLNPLIAVRDQIVTSIVCICGLTFAVSFREQLHQSEKSKY